MLALVSLALAAILGFGQTSTAIAIADVADALRDEPVFVEEGSDVLTDREVDELRSSVADADRAIYIALLRNETVDAVGGIDNALRQLRTEVGLSGTYVLAIDGEIRTTSNTVPSADLIAAALNRGGGDRLAILQDFIARVDAYDGSRGSGETSGGESGGSNGGGSLMPLLLVGGAVAGGAYLLTRGSRKANRAAAEQQRVALQGAQQDLLAELSVLADDVLRLEPEVQVHPEARQDYEAAISRYRWLEAAIPQIDSPDDPPRIQRAMTEARYAMARAQAIVRGHEPPPPPVELTQQGHFGEPAIEIDEQDEYRRPRYAGYGGGWYGGGFFGGNDLFTGLLLGSMLSGGFGGFGWGGGFGGHGNDGGGDNGNDGGGWGDFGGGDFGGGDFGGGDFGGGDW